MKGILKKGERQMDKGCPSLRPAVYSGLRPAERDVIVFPALPGGLARFDNSQNVKMTALEDTSMFRESRNVEIHIRLYADRRRSARTK